MKAVTSQLTNVPSNLIEQTLKQQDTNKFCNQYDTNNDDNNNIIASQLIKTLLVNEGISDSTSSVELQLALSQSKQQRQAGKVVVETPTHKDQRYKIGEHNSDGMGTTSHSMQNPQKYIKAQNSEGTRHLDKKDGDGDSGARISESYNQKVEQLRYEKNVQFTFVKSNETESQPLNVTPKQSQDNMQQELLATKYIENVIKERNRFIEAIAANPLYGNEIFSEPWKVVSKIANQIVDDTITLVENSVNFGEEKFVKDFIRMELDV